MLAGPEEYVGIDLSTTVAPTTSELTAFLLLVAWFLVVASASSAGRTVCAAGAAGLTAGLATISIGALSSVVLTVTAWPLLMLLVALVVVLRPVDDVRQRLHHAGARTVRRLARYGAG